MRKIAKVSMVGLVLAFAGCGKSSSEAASDTRRLTAYEPCEQDADCDAGLNCVALLGANVCTRTGCATVDVCVTGETCVVSAAIDPDGVCALTGSNQFCARNCRDRMVCNLKPECAENGCCTDIDEDGCPTVCNALDTMDCEISPQCPAECCGG